MSLKETAEYTSNIVDLIKRIDSYHGNVFKDRSIEHICKEAQVIWEFVNENINIEQNTALFESAKQTATSSNNWAVRVPKSLHAALEREASNEGVSLNQLVVTKLAVQLSQIEVVPNLEEDENDNNTKP